MDERNKEEYSASKMPQNRKMRVFWISLILTTLRNLFYWPKPFLSTYLVANGVLNTEYYRYIIDLLGYTISLATIYIGYRIGRNMDIKNEYRFVIKYLGAGWIASSLICVPVYIFSDEVWRSMIITSILYVFTLRLNVGAVLFSSMTLGTVIRDGMRFKKEWNPVILRPVLVYNGVLLLQSLGQRMKSFILLNSSNRSAPLWINTVLGLIVYPFWLWYLFRMYSSGRNIELKEDYGSVLYTILVPTLVYLTLSHLGTMIFYYLRDPSLMMLLNLPVAYGLRFVSSTLGILGLPFALLCYGYINSKTNISRTEAPEYE